MSTKMLIYERKQTRAPFPLHVGAHIRSMALSEFVQYHFELYWVRYYLFTCHTKFYSFVYSSIKCKHVLNVFHTVARTASLIKVRSKWSRLILTPADSTCLAGLAEIFALGMMWGLITPLSRLNERFKPDIVLLLDKLYPNAEVNAPVARGSSGLGTRPTGKSKLLFLVHLPSPF